MTEDKGILIKNIFYMLTYAFRVLNQTNYENIKPEDFKDIFDLFGEILARGMSQQIKQGLHKEYVLKNDHLMTLKGKVDMLSSIRNKMNHKNYLACEFDELSENNLMNQIIKTTAVRLSKHKDVIRSKASLMKALRGFEKIDEVEMSSIPWSTLTFQRNNQSYRMLIYVCWFVLNRMLLSTEKGEYRMQQFNENNMAMLYESFIREYYVKNYNHLHPQALHVDFNLQGEITSEALAFLPEMKTDITLSNDIKTLIIDAKYYKRIWQCYDIEDPNTSKTIRNAHLYQIMTYVGNTDKQHIGNVGGVLLYAQTGEQQFDLEFPGINGNPYIVRTLDLNTDFKEIRNQLNKLVDDYFESTVFSSKN